MKRLMIAILLATAPATLTAQVGVGVAPYITAAWRNVLAESDPVFDVRAYGAVGNGSTDDTEAIQAALAAASAATEPDAIVYVPPGDYLIDSGDLDLPDHIVLTGPGRLSFSGTYGINAEGTDYARIDGIQLHGSGDPSQVLLYFHRSSEGDSPARNIVQNVTFTNAGNAIYLTYGWQFVFEGNQFYSSIVNGITVVSGSGNCSKGTPFGVVNAVHITGNTDLSCSGTNVRLGDYINNGGENAHVKHCWISPDVTIQGPGTSTGVILENCDDVTIQAYFEGQIKGIVMQGRFQQEIHIANACFRGNSVDFFDPAIDMDYAFGADCRGISLEQCKFVNCLSELTTSRKVETVKCDNNGGLDDFSGVDAETHIDLGMSSTDGLRFKPYAIADGSSTIEDYQSGRLITNENFTGGCIKTLPSAEVGMCLEILANNPTYVIFADPYGTENFRGLSAGYRLKMFPGSYVKIKCTETGVWDIVTFCGPVMSDQDTGDPYLREVYSVGNIVVSNGATSAGCVVFANDTDDGDYNGTMSPTTLTADRRYTLPDASGTVALQSTVSGTLVLDDGATERITLVFTNGILTSRTVEASVAALQDWTD